MGSPFLPVDMSGLRVAITAGGDGIGRVIAAAFLDRGAQVCICDISAAALEQAAKAMPDVRAAEADVADPAAVAAWFGAIEKALGGLDVLVNNAGIAGPTARVEDVATEELEATLD